MAIDLPVLVKSPAEMIEGYPAALNRNVNSWMTMIQTQITTWWSELTRDCIVIELPPHTAPDLKMEIIDRLQSRAWSVKEGNNGKYLILEPTEGVEVRGVVGAVDHKEDSEK